MLEVLIAKAITDIEAKLVKQFDTERLELQNDQTRLEAKTRDLEARLKKAEDSRSQLLDANANLENKLGVALSAHDGKIKKVLQLAFDDADFYNKII